MPFVVSCPHCQAKYRLKDKKKGFKVQCKNCGGTFRAGPKSARQTGTAAPVPAKIVQPIDVAPTANVVPQVNVAVPAQVVAPAKIVTPAKVVARAEVVTPSPVVPAVEAVPASPVSPTTPDEAKSDDRIHVVSNKASSSPKLTSDAAEQIVSSDEDNSWDSFEMEADELAAGVSVESLEGGTETQEENSGVLEEAKLSADSVIGESKDSSKGVDENSSAKEPNRNPESELDIDTDSAADEVGLAANHNEDNAPGEVDSDEAEFTQDEYDEDDLLIGVREEIDLERSTPTHELDEDDLEIDEDDLTLAPDPREPSSAIQPATPISTASPPLATPQHYAPTATTYAPVHPVPAQPTVVTAATPPTPVAEVVAPATIPANPPSGPNIVLPKEGSPPPTTVTHTAQPVVAVPTQVAPVAAQPAPNTPSPVSHIASQSVPVTPVVPVQAAQPVIPVSPVAPTNPVVATVQPVSPVAPPPQAAPLAPPVPQAPLRPTGPVNLAGQPVGNTKPPKTRRERLNESNSRSSYSEGGGSGNVFGLVIGIAAIFLGIALTVASFQSENRGGVVFFGLVIYGLFQIASALSGDD